MSKKVALVLLAVIILGLTLLSFTRLRNGLTPQPQIITSTKIITPTLTVSTSVTASSSFITTLQTTISTTSTIASSTQSGLRLVAYEWDVNTILQCDPSDTLPMCFQFDVVNTGSTMLKVIAVSLSMSDPTGGPTANGEGVGGLSNPVYHNQRVGFSVPLSNKFGPPSPSYSCPAEPIPYSLQVITSPDGGVTRQTFLFMVYCASPGVWITLY